MRLEPVPRAVRVRKRTASRKRKEQKEIEEFQDSGGNHEEGLSAEKREAGKMSHSVKHTAAKERHLPPRPAGQVKPHDYLQDLKRKRRHGPKRNSTANWNRKLDGV